jgi:large subunit ribosomal protein L23
MVSKSKYEILRRPIITEKSSFQNSKLNQVVFEVDLQATKATVKAAIESIFDVKVLKVRTMIVPGKKKMSGKSRRLVSRRKKYKKAIITLAEGESIDVFEGVQ